MLLFVRAGNPDCVNIHRRHENRLLRNRQQPRAKISTILVWIGAYFLRQHVATSFEVFS
jgi:hypothetical protein